MAVKDYLARLLGAAHNPSDPTQLDCEGLDLKNTGDLTAETLTVTGALSAGSGSVNGSAVVTEAMQGDVEVEEGVSAIGANKILSAMVSPLLLKYTSVAVSSAELLAINAVPKTLVAAASGYIHLVHRAVLVLNYNSAAYANNGILGIYETDAAGTLLTGTLTLASFLAQTADTIKELHPLAHSATTGLTRLDNKAIVLTQATGESISGNSPITVHLWYSTIPHAL